MSVRLLSRAWRSRFVSTRVGKAVGEFEDSKLRISRRPSVAFMPADPDARVLAVGDDTEDLGAGCQGVCRMCGVAKSPCVNVTRCCGHLACCGQQKRAGSLPPFWPLSLFFVAGVKFLGCLGKQVREREFVPRMAGLFALGHGCFPISFGVSWSGIGIVF